MAAITHLAKPDAAERSTSNTALTEITQRTISWSDLTTAGFAASDVVFIIWNWSLGADSFSNNAICNIGRGTTFAGRTDWFPVDILEEAQSTSSLAGQRHFGWIEQHTLVVNENIYFSLGGVSTRTSRSANFNCTIIKRADLDADDYRYDAQANAIAVTTDFADGRDAAVTLPSASGGDWLILGCGNWDVGSTAVSLEQRLSIDGVGTVMFLRHEGEDTAEQLPFMCVYPLDSAAASQVVTFEGREDSSSSFVLDASRVLALRLEAFADHITLHDTTSDALSTTPDTYVETGTVDLVLGATGDVFVIGQSIISDGSLARDPYLRLQEGDADIISAMGRASSSVYDTTDNVGVVTHVIGSMTSGTKTIDMDVAQDVSTDAANVAERSLVAFSLELAAADGSVASAVGTSTVSGTGESDAEADASSVGVAVVSGEGRSEAEAVASSFGTSVVSGIGESDAEAVAAAAGIAVVSGVGDFVGAGSVASAAGTSTAVAIGVSDAEAVAVAVGIAAVLGVSDLTVPFVNLAPFQLGITFDFKSTQGIALNAFFALAITKSDQFTLEL